MPEFDKYADEYAELLRDPIRDRFAPGSGFFFERKWELIETYFRTHRLSAADTDWLDVGCGKGDLLRIGAPRVRRAVGCDLSQEMLANCTGLDVVLQAEPTRLPFPDGQFSLATAVCVYHHVPIPARARLTSELFRVLRPGGIACIIEHNPFNPATQMIVRRTPVDADAQLLSAGLTRKILAAGRFTRLATEYFLYFPENLYRKLHPVEHLLRHVPGGGQYAAFGQKA